MSQTSTAFKEGAEAQQLGKPKDYNPYPVGTVKHFQWSEGWDQNKKQVEDERE